MSFNFDDTSDDAPTPRQVQPRSADMRDDSRTPSPLSIASTTASKNSIGFQSTARTLPIVPVQLAEALCVDYLPRAEPEKSKAVLAKPTPAKSELAKPAPAKPEKQQNVVDAAKGPAPAADAGTTRLVSQGSIGHPLFCAPPCKYEYKARQKGRGCKDGSACDHCHLCDWKQTPRHWRKGMVKDQKRKGSFAIANDESAGDAMPLLMAPQ
jgi:hypothetical protein